MNNFIRTGNITRHVNSNNFAVTWKLDPKIYALQRGAGEFYLEELPAFPLPDKLYGNINRMSDRIYTTFMDRSVSTGVMLSGEKGSGKSLLAKRICTMAAANGVPTLVVSYPYCDDAFKLFIQSIDQPTIVLFDEFEKTYDQEAQAALLSLFDGVFPTQKLFLITCNDKWAVDVHMKNRPGRIYYSIDFVGVDESLIREYCEDNLHHTEYLSDICKLGALFPALNIDMLKAIVEEVNRYGEPPHEVIKILNTKPEYSEGVVFAVSLSINGIPINASLNRKEVWAGNPLTENLHFEYQEPDDEEDGWSWRSMHFTTEDLLSINAETKQYFFQNSDGHQARLTKVQPYVMNRYPID